MKNKCKIFSVQSLCDCTFLCSVDVDGLAEAVSKLRSECVRGGRRCKCTKTQQKRTFALCSLSFFVSRCDIPPLVRNADRCCFGAKALFTTPSVVRGSGQRPEPFIAVSVNSEWAAPKLNPAFCLPYTPTARDRSHTGNF